MTHRFSNGITCCLLFAAGALGLVPPTASAAGIGGKAFPKAVGNFNNPAVMPVNSKPHGLSYGEWSTRFWQWQLSMPVNANPIFNTADCSAGQSGRVWFLGGSTVAFESAPGEFLARTSRTCTVPPGTMLFFPIVNNECSTVEGDRFPGYSGTPADLEACAKFASSFIVPSTLSATLDGVPIKALTQYKVTSPLFSFGPLPNNNVLQFFGLVAPAGTTAQSVSDGIHLMLHPLATGRHILHFYAESDFGPIGGTRFIQDITYYIRVAP